MADDGFNVPTDAFVEILLRLPPSSRRRLRLVCKRWRDVVDERTPERHVRTKILAFRSRPGSSSALVFDSRDRLRRHSWTYPTSYHDGYVDLVGTCNGLLCLRGFLFPGTLVVANPITRHKLFVPRLPDRFLPPLEEMEPLGQPAEASKGAGIYSFGYHPLTGQYKVVHVACQSGTTTTTMQKKNSVLVFTLGHEAWREVPADLHPCVADHRNASIVSVDGSAYWFTTPRCDRVTALDLDAGERVASFDAPPVMRLVNTSAAAIECRLTSVHARLGVVVARRTSAATTRLDVWVLEGRRGGGADQSPSWSRRHSLVEPSGADQPQGRWITAPHFTHGEYVVSASWDGKLLCLRRVGNLTCRNDRTGKNEEVLPLELEGAQLLLLIRDGEEWDTIKTFAYVETLEPLPHCHLCSETATMADPLMCGK